jgi:hypothetical protein
VLHGCQFANNEEVKVHTWLHAQPKTFFMGGIRKLVDQSNKCVEKLEDLSKNDNRVLLVHLLYNKE